MSASELAFDYISLDPVEVHILCGPVPLSSRKLICPSPMPSTAPFIVSIVKSSPFIVSIVKKFGV